MKQFLVDLRGERVKAKLVKGRFGPAWALLDADGKFRGVFITNSPGALQRQGYKVREEEDSVDKPDAVLLVPLTMRQRNSVADVLEVYLKGGWVKEPHAAKELQLALESLRNAKEESDEAHQG